MDLDPGADLRLAVDPRRADAELPPRQPKRFAQPRSGRRFADRLAIFDAIVGDGLARHLGPGAGFDLLGKVIGEFGVGRLAIPFCPCLLYTSDAADE